MPELKDILVHNPECVVREIEEGLIIMPPQVTTTHSLNNLSAFIWNQIDGKRNLETILSAIMDEYNVSDDLARADLLSFVEELLTAELVGKVVP
ncbi:MAG: PqqD family protein [Gemmatimonadales bacterium]|nr:PqqD family protein [Gemmatimonadales bacterium]